jgi:hypothetical protein
MLEVWIDNIFDMFGRGVFQQTVGITMSTYKCIVFGCLGHDCVVVGFTTTYAISAMEE